jgi:hypothetical protein
MTRLLPGAIPFISRDLLKVTRMALFYGTLGILSGELAAASLLEWDNQP